MAPRTQLLRDALRLVRAAALLSAPLFLFAEGFSAASAVRVAASNGAAALLCSVLLRRLADRNALQVGRGLVLGLLVLVGALASTNGEPVHVNVINFVLVTLLAGALLPRRELLAVAASCAAAMATIAWRQAVAPPGEELLEARFEAIVQFLPTYAVIVALLVRRGRLEEANAA
ncbi:MAG: hypothetical protein JNL90_15110 [Planctomycetes bacterium]|nr:hypothetical protein [Planctomycetota bacterium]